MMEDGMMKDEVSIVLSSIQSPKESSNFQATDEALRFLFFQIGCLMQT